MATPPSDGLVPVSVLVLALTGLTGMLSLVDRFVALEARLVRVETALQRVEKSLDRGIPPGEMRRPGRQVQLYQLPHQTASVKVLTPGGGVHQERGRL